MVPYASCHRLGRGHTGIQKHSYEPHAQKTVVHKQIERTAHFISSNLCTLREKKKDTERKYSICFNEVL